LNFYTKAYTANETLPYFMQYGKKSPQNTVNCNTVAPCFI
jgi:hypothetical protein